MSVVIFEYIQIISHIQETYMSEVINLFLM